MGFKITDDILERYTEEEGITEVVIPDGIRIIYENAFENCRNIEKLVIPEGVEIIENYAFYWCSSLIDISIPKSVKVIGDEVFYNTPWLWKNLKENPVLVVNGILIKSIAEGKTEIPYGVTAIQNYAFHACVHLTLLRIPDTVESIGKEVFSYCSNLAGIELLYGNEKLKIHTTGCIIDSDGNLKYDIDKLFAFLKADEEEKERMFLEDTEYKILFAMYLMFRKNNEAAIRYIQKNVTIVGKHLIDMDYFEDMKRLLKSGCVSRIDADMLMNYSVSLKKPNFNAAIAKYKVDSFEIHNGFKNLLLD